MNGFKRFVSVLLLLALPPLVWSEEVPRAESETKLIEPAVSSPVPGDGETHAASPDPVERKPDDFIQRALAEVDRESLLISDPEKIRRRFLEFMNKYPSGRTELNKISYLLDLIRSSKKEFIRNNDRYTGVKAAAWLRWKMMHPQYKKEPILTARDFVERVADHSRATGRDYEVITVSGRRRLQDILRNELHMLELLLAFVPRTVVETDSSITEGTHG
jgi:hypothetical protein